MFWRAATVWLITATWGALSLHAEPPPSSPTTPPSSSAPVDESISVRDVPGTELTWRDCVRLATQNNPDLQSSREAVLNSDAVRMGAYSALYPQISVSFGDTRSYVGAGLYSPSNYSTAYSEQISASQIIFNGFATKGNIDQARAQLNLALANLDGQKATTSFNLKSAFAQLIYAEKLITLSRNVIDIRQNAARLVKLLYEGGSEDKGAMLLEQAELDQSIYNLDQAERNLDLSSLQLMEIMGKDLPQPLVAEGELLTNPLTVMPDYKELAVRTPLYYQRQAEVAASAAGITIANSGWYPTITATASADRSDSQFPLKNHGWSAGFQVSYPLFEGGQTYFNVKAEYDRQLANLQSVDVTRNVDQASVIISDHASEATSVKPGWGRTILTGMGGGLVVGLIILFLIDQLDDRVSSLMELQTYFPEHLLGQIPHEKLDTAGPLLRVGDDRQALIESFRTLRSSIIFLPVEGKRPKTIAVTSALPNEGKTTVASNLAVTLAFSGAKTLFIDGDMRSGKASRLFGAQDSNGFSSVLLQKMSWTDAVYLTPIDHLYLMPCGPSLHHTSEHLLGKVTDQFLINVYDHFDYIVFDTPPVIILDDTLCLAPKIDATLFVIRFNSSSTRSSRRALELLDQRQANVIGMVCNGVTLSETEYAYNYNYRQYRGKYAEPKVPA